MNGLEVDTLRADTPGVAHCVHLNNAGAALPTRRTLDTVVGHLHLEAEIGGYEAAALRSNELDAVRSSIASLLGGRRDEVAVTTGDTAAWAKAFWGFVHGGGIRRGDTVVVDRVVYNSHHFAVLQAARQLELSVEVVGALSDGSLDLTALERALEHSPALLTLTHVPTHSGVVAPVAEAGRRANDAGVPFFLDACQSVGQLPVDVGQIGCDVLTATGRKWLRGPRGTGFLWVRRELVDVFDPPGIDTASAEWIEHDRVELLGDARRFEEFEQPHAAVLGLGAAVDQLLEVGIDAVAARIADVASHLREALDTTPRVRTTDGDRSTSGIVTFVHDDLRPDEVADRARAEGINVGVSSAPMALLDLPERGLDEVVRVSPHVYSTTAELDRFVALL